MKKSLFPSIFHYYITQMRKVQRFAGYFIRMLTVEEKKNTRAVLQNTVQVFLHTATSAYRAVICPCPIIEIRAEHTTVIHP